MNIIDFHTHIGGFIIPNIKGVYEVRAEYLIECMDEVGVEKAVSSFCRGILAKL